MFPFVNFILSHDEIRVSGGRGCCGCIGQLFVGSPNRRHLLLQVNEKVYGSSHHIKKIEEELKKKQQLCTPEEAVKLVVDLRVPRRSYPILQKFITTFGRAFCKSTGMHWYP